MGKQHGGQSQPLSAGEIQKQMQGDTPEIGIESKGLVSAADMEAKVRKEGYAPVLQTMQTSIDNASYSKYLQTIKPLENIDLQRANNQRWYSQAGNALVQSVGEVVGGTVEGLGSIPGLFQAVNDEVTNQSADFDNAILEFGRSIREGAQDIAPIYRTNPGEAFDVMDSGWWFSNVPSVFSTLSMLVPAKAATSGLSLLSKMGKAGRLGKLGKALSGMNAGTKYATKLALGAAVSRNAENFREAYQVYDGAYNQTLNSLQGEEGENIKQSETYREAKEYYGTDNITDDQFAQYVGSRASWRSYQINSANIVFDALQFAPLLKGAKITTRTGALGKTAKLLEKNGQKLSRLQKIMYGANPIVSPIASQLSEGVEEAINFIGTEEGNYYAQQLLDYDGDEETKFSTRLGEYMQDGHMWEGATWGVLGGTVYSGVGAMIAKDTGPQSKTAKFAEINNRKNLITTATSSIAAVEAAEDLDPKTKEKYVQAIKKNVAYELGRNAAKAGNVDLLLEQLEDPKFQQTLVDGGYATQEELQESVASVKEQVLLAESLYKKHAGKFFYSDVSQRTKAALESAYSNLERAKQENSKNLRDAESALRNIESGLNLDQDQQQSLDAKTYAETLAVLDNLANEAVKDGQQERAESYREMSREVQASMSNLNVPVPKTLPKNITTDHLVKKVETLMYKLHDTIYNNRQQELSSKEGQAKAEEQVKKAEDRAVKDAKKKQLEFIQEQTEVSDTLKNLANDKNVPEDIRKAAAKRIVQLNRAAANGNAAEAARAEHDNLVEGEPTEPSPTPGNDPGEGPVPTPNGQPNEAPNMDIFGKPAPVNEDAQDLRDLVDVSSGEDSNIPIPPSPSESAENDRGQIIGADGRVINVKNQPTAEDQASDIDEELLELVEDVELDMYVLGQDLLNGFSIANGSAAYSVNDLTDSLLGDSLDAIYNLQSGDILTIRRVTPKKGAEYAEVVNQDGVPVGRIYSLAVAEYRARQARSGRDAEKAMIEQSRADKTKKVWEVLNKAKGDVEVVVTSQNSGNLINTAEPSSIEPFKEIIEEDGLWYAESDLLLQSSKDPEDVMEVSEQDNSPINQDDSFTKGRVYVRVQGIDGRLIPVPLLSPTIAEAGATTSFKDAMNNLISTLQQNPDLDIKNELIENALAQVAQYAHTRNQVSGITVHRVGNYLSIMLPVQNGRALEIVIKDKFGVNSTPKMQVVDINSAALDKGKKYAVAGSGKPVNMTVDQAMEAAAESLFLDVNNERLNQLNSEPFTVKNKEGVEQTYDSYLDFLTTVLKTNLAHFKTKQGVRFASPITSKTNAGYGATIQFDFVGVADKKVVKPTLGNSTPAPKSPATKAPAVKPAGIQGRQTNLTDKTYNKFVDTGKVPITVRRKIAQKLVDGEKLTAKEESVRQAYAQEIENMLQAAQGSAVSTVHNAPSSSVGVQGTLFDQQDLDPTPVEDQTDVKDPNDLPDLPDFGPIDAGSGLLLRTDGTKVPFNGTEDLDAAEAWFKKAFPHVPFIRVRGLIENGGQLAYGMFANASVVLSNQAIQGTVYHEAFHTAMHLYLDESQRNQIYAEAREKHGNKPDLELEEIIAEEFRAHMILKTQEAQPKTAIGRWFKKLAELVRMFVSKPTHTERLFRDIQSGKFNYKPTQQMLNHAERFTANLAVEGLTSIQERQVVVNTMAPLIHFGLNQVINQHADYFKNNPDVAMAPILERMLVSTLERYTTDPRFNNENAQKVLDAFKDHESGKIKGLFSKALEAYRVRFGIDLANATPRTLNLSKRMGNSMERIEMSNEDIDGLYRNYGDSLLNFNGKDSISSVIKDAIMTSFKLKSFNTLDYIEGGLSEIRDDDVQNSTFLGTAEFIDFDTIYPYMESNLYGIGSVKEMMNRIAEFSQSADPSFGSIYLKLAKDKNLQSAFFSHFSKQRPTIYLPTVGSDIDNGVQVFPINTNNSELLIIDRFKAQALDAPAATSKSITKGMRMSLPNDTFAEAVSESLSRMGMSLVENGVDVVAKAVARELDKGTVTKKKLVQTVQHLAEAFETVDRTKNEVFYNNRGNLSFFGKMVQFYKLEAIQNVMQNVEGKNIYGITHSTMMSNFFDMASNPARILEFRKRATEMLKDERIQRSAYFKTFLNLDANGDPIFGEDGLVEVKESRDDLGYGLLDGLKNDDSFSGVKYSGMVASEFDVLSVAMFVQGLEAGNGDYITTPTVIPSDKSTLYMLKSPVFGRRGMPEYDKALKNAIVGDLMAAIKESERVFKDVSAPKPEAKDNVSLQMYANTNKKGEVITEGRAFQPTLVSVEELRNHPIIGKIFYENGLINRTAITSEVIAAYVEYIKQNVLAAEASSLREKFSKNPKATELIKKYNRSGEFYMDFAMHNFLHNYEYGVLFHAPSSEFKNNVETNKRGASATTPGITLDPAVVGETFNAMTIEDVVRPAANYKAMEDTLTMNLSKQGVKNPRSQAAEILKAYKNIETTDAQGYVTLDRYESIVRARGMWNAQWETMFAKARKGEDLDIGESKVFLQPLKPLYYGREYDPKMGRMKSDLVKLSSMPLVPAMIKGTELEKLNDYMTDKKNNVQEAFYLTAHKVGATNVARGGKRGVFTPSTLRKSNIQRMYNRNYQIQLDTPEHLVDTTNKIGSQLSKLILSNLSPTARYGSYGSAKALNDAYQKSTSEYIKLAHDALMEQIGAKPQADGSYKADPKKLEAVIQRELADRKASKMLREALTLDEKGNFIIPPFFSGFANKFESILLSMFTNNITNLKAAGISAIQASSAFYAPDGKRPSVVFKEDGGIDYYEIFIPAYMKSEFTDADGKVKNIEDIDPKALELIGYRIPTEGKSSMAPLRVAGFLPNAMGSTVIVPDEFVVQMGSDFDVDKLFIQRRNIGDKLTPMQERQNEIFDVFQTVLQEPAHMQEVVTPQGFDTLKDIAYKIQEETEAMNPLLYSSQAEFRQRNATGSRLIGIAANINVFASVAQVTGMSFDDSLGFNIEYTVKDPEKRKALQKKYGEKNVSISGDRVRIKHTAIGAAPDGSYTSMNDRLISSSLAEFVGATVDNAKDPIFDKFNGNTYTLPTMMAMVSTGVPMEMVLNFFAQRSIREAARINLDAKGIFGDGFVDEFSEVETKIINKINTLTATNRLPRKQVKASQDIYEIFASHNVEPNIHLNLKTLTNSLKDEANYSNLTAEQKINYQITQLAMLRQFKDYKAAGNAIVEGYTMFKTDVAGAGPSTSVTHRISNTIQNSLESITVYDTENPKGRKTSALKIGDLEAAVAIYPQEFSLDQKSAYPILEAYFENSNKRSLEILSDLFYTEGVVAQSAINIILEDVNNNRWDDTIVRKAKNLINQRLVYEVAFSSANALDIESVLKGSEEIKTSADVTKDNYKDASAAQLLAYVKRNYPEMEQNPLHIVSRLTPPKSLKEVTENQGLQLISFDNITDTAIDEMLSDSLDDMMFGNDPILAELANKLVHYNFYTKGMSFQRGSFSKIFSPKVLNKYGIGEGLTKRLKHKDLGTLFGDSPAMVYAATHYKDFKGFPVSKNKIKFSPDSSGNIPSFSATFKTSSSNPKPFIYDRKADRLYRLGANNDGVVTYVQMTKKGIPGTLVEFEKNSIVHQNLDTAVANYSKFSTGALDDAQTVDEKVSTLQDNFRTSMGINVKVVTDENMKENAKVETKDGQTVITLSSNVFSDTVIHEFGHIYVDLLGVKNPLVAQGIAQLKGSKLWKEVEARYPELSGEALAKEVLVTAIGLEGAKIYSEARSEKKWRIWLNKFFRAVGKLFGVEPNAARELARQMIQNDMQRGSQPLSDYTQFQKRPDSVEEYLEDTQLKLKKLALKYKNSGGKVFENLYEEFSMIQKSDALLRMGDQIDQTLRDAAQYIDKQEAFLQEEGNLTRENLDALFASLANVRQALVAFEDVKYLDSSMGENKKVKKALKKLNNQSSRIESRIAQIDRMSQKYLNILLKQNSSNPKVQEEVFNLFKGEGIEFADENWAQHRLDALADTNFALIALTIKDYNIEKELNTERIKAKKSQWQDLVAEMKSKGISMDSFFEVRDGKRTGKFVNVRSAQYKALSTAQKEYLNKIKNLMGEMVAHSNSKFVKYGYLPAVPVEDKSFWDAVKNVFKKDPNRPDEDEATEVLVDESGNIINMIPMRYMQKFTELDMVMPTGNETPAELAELKKKNDEIKKKNEEFHAKAISYDLENTMEMFIESALNHRFKTNMEGRMLLIKEQLRNMDVTRTISQKDKVKSLITGESSAPKIKGEQSKIFDHYDMWLKMVFYEQFEADENKTWRALAKNTQNYMSLTRIGLNVFSGINNKIYGEIQMSIEAAAGQFFGPKEWAAGKKFYFNNLMHYLKGSDKIKSDNFAAALIKRFDVLQTQDELQGKIDGNSAMHKLAMIKDKLYFMQHAGEHSMQNQALFSMLMAEKVMLNGKEVSLMDALELRDGVIKIKQGAKTKDGKALTDRDLARFKTKVIGVNQYLHGIYNKDDAGTIQHMALGRLAMQFRKWARPGWNKRFGSKAGKSFWNERRDMTDEGMYVSAFNFGVQLLKDLRRFENNAKLHWNNLSDMQKANVRRTMMEMTYLVASSILAGLAFGLADDDEDSRVLGAMLHMTDRVHTELSTYLPWGIFNEGKKLMASPIASMSLYESSFKLLSHVVTMKAFDHEEAFFRGGMYYGERKATMWVKQMIPILGQIERIKHINQSAQYYKLYSL